MQSVVAEEYRGTHVNAKATNPHTDEGRTGNTLIKHVSKDLGIKKLLNQKLSAVHQPNEKADIALNAAAPSGADKKSRLNKDGKPTSLAASALSKKTASRPGTEANNAKEANIDEANTISPARDLLKKLSRGVARTRDKTVESRTQDENYKHECVVTSQPDPTASSTIPSRSIEIQPIPVHGETSPPKNNGTSNSVSPTAALKKKLSTSSGFNWKNKDLNRETGDISLASTVAHGNRNEAQVRSVPATSPNASKVLPKTITKSFEDNSSARTVTKPLANAHVSTKTQSLSVFHNIKTPSTQDDQNSDSTSPAAKLFKKLSSGLHWNRRSTSQSTTDGAAETFPEAHVNTQHSSLPGNTPAGSSDIATTPSGPVRASMTGMSSLTATRHIATAGVQLPSLVKQSTEAKRELTAEVIIASAARVQAAALQVQTAAVELEAAAAEVQEAAAEVEEMKRGIPRLSVPRTTISTSGPTEAEGSQPSLEKKTSSSILIKKISDRFNMGRLFNSSSSVEQDARLQRMSSPVSRGTSRDKDDSGTPETSGPSLIKMLSGKIDIRNKIFNKKEPAQTVAQGDANTPHIVIPAA